MGTGTRVENHKYIGHNYVGHNYVGHNYVGHNYAGQNYRGTHAWRALVDGVSARTGTPVPHALEVAVNSNPDPPNPQPQTCALLFFPGRTMPTAHADGPIGRGRVETVPTPPTHPESKKKARTGDVGGPLEVPHHARLRRLLGLRQRAIPFLFSTAGACRRRTPRARVDRRPPPPPKKKNASRQNQPDATLRIRSSPSVLAAGTDRNVFFIKSDRRPYLSYVASSLALAAPISVSTCRP